MIQFACTHPKCTNKVGALAMPKEPVVCPGFKISLDNPGERSFVHRPREMVIVNPDGTQRPQPKLPKGTSIKMPKELNTCACYSKELANGVRVSCGAQVKGTFAPGHDAKLKGILIRAAAAGQTLKISDNADGSKAKSVDPMTMAAGRTGWSAIVAKGVKLAQDKASKPKAERKTNRVDKPVKVNRDELRARAEAKAAQRAQAKATAKPKGTPAKKANAAKKAAKTESLV